MTSDYIEGHVYAGQHELEGAVDWEAWALLYTTPECVGAACRQCGSVVRDLTLHALCHGLIVPAAPPVDV